MRFLVVMFVTLLSLFAYVEAEERGVPGYVNLIEGTFTVTFTPKSSGGTGGFWRAAVVSPSGQMFATAEIPYDSLDPVSLLVTIDGLSVELGTYAILVRNEIVHEGLTDLMDSVSVTTTIPNLCNVGYHNIASSLQGEAVEMFLRILKCTCSE
jgi:hypothetical protein